MFAAIIIMMFAVIIIMLACLCNVDPLGPHFYIVKMGFTGVYIISYFCLKT